MNLSLAKTTFILVLLKFCNGRPAEISGNIDEQGTHLGGDVILPPGLNLKNGLVGENFRWPNKTLIYTLDVDFVDSERQEIADAMAEIEELTCIRFQERENETAYVFVAKGGDGTGCYSFLGRLGGVQQLNLEYPGCIRRGIIVHEFLHAIGFYHEQSREDRDDFVTINWDNIRPGTEFNFLKATITLKYNVTYDYDSIMHYSQYAFAQNSSVPTIIPLDPDAEIGQRERMSVKDAYKVNAMYCPEEAGELPLP